MCKPNHYCGVNLSKLRSRKGYFKPYISLVESIMREKKVYVSEIRENIAICHISEYDFLGGVHVPVDCLHTN